MALRDMRIATVEGITLRLLLLLVAAVACSSTGGDDHLTQSPAPDGAGGADTPTAAGPGGASSGSGGCNDCGAVGGADAGGADAGELPAGGAPLGGSGGFPVGGAGGADSGGAGGDTGARCDAIATCAADPAPCTVAEGSEGPLCSLENYICGNHVGWHTSDNMDFPCDAGNCADAITAALSHCFPQCSCPGPNAWPDHGYISCDPGTVACKVFCFDGYTASGDQCLASQKDPCWDTCVFGYCVDGECLACPLGQLDCNDDAADACESAMSSDNCGQCNFSCAAGDVCTVTGNSPQYMACQH